MAAIPPLFGNTDPNDQVAQQRRMQEIARQLMGGAAGGQGNAFEPLSHPMQVVGKLSQAGVDMYKQNRRKDALYGPMAQLGAPKGLF